MKKWLSEEEIKEELIILLKEFTEFCDKHKLRYSLDGGTLIGAIRHEGFIPWDDDIDVMMPRDDYNYLRENFKSDSSYFLDVYTNKYYHLPVGKIISNRTGGYEKGYKKFRKYGVFLDVFPLDKIPVDERIFYEFSFINKIKADKCLIMCSTRWYSWDYPLNKKDLLLYLLLLPLSICRRIWYRNIVGFRPLFKKMENNFKKTKLNKSILNDWNYDFKNRSVRIQDKYAYMYWGDYTFDMAFSLEDFDNYKEVKFEDIKCRAIRTYDSYLKKFYSGDYMKLPPIEKQVKAHTSRFYWKGK